jgi:hypothetical protein
MCAPAELAKPAATAPKIVAIKRFMLSSAELVSALDFTPLTQNEHGLFRRQMQKVKAADP